MQRGDHHHRHGTPAGAGLSVPVLAFAAALVTAIIMLISDWTVHATRQVDCSAFSSFLDRRHQHAHVQQMLSEAAALPAAQAAAQAQAAAAAPGLLPATATALGGVASDAMRRVGWRSGVKFARFGEWGLLQDWLPQQALPCTRLCSRAGEDARVSCHDTV